ncbi:MAG: hypothetical protein MJY44_00670 [Bacteroidales bacterium]|nr:hypothetical protein [Bacteroidales bacterium]
MKRFIVLIITALCAAAALAQPKLPEFGRDASILSGTLPNGMDYMIAPGNIPKGKANFILLQKGRDDREQMRADLDSCFHYGIANPTAYLASNGVGFGEGGFVRSHPGAMAFHFDNVPTGREPVIDSTLLLLYDLALDFKGKQTLIIAGDVNAEETRRKISVLSMLVPGITVPEERQAPQTPVAMPFRREFSTSGGISTVKATLSVPGVSRDKLATPLPYVTESLCNIFADIASIRFQEYCKSDGIAICGLDYNHTPPLSGDGYDKITVSFRCNEADAGKAWDLLIDSFHSIVLHPASPDEFEAASRATDSRRMVGPFSNGELAGRCIDHILLGTNLASATTLNNFFSTHRLSGAGALDAFNNFCASLADRPAERQFSNPSAAVLDTLASFRQRVKVKSTSAEPSIGGTLILFSNGVKAIYRKSTYRPGRVMVGYAVRGDASMIPGIKPAETNYLKSMLALGKIAGIPARQFFGTLQGYGVSLTADASLSDITISGTTAVESLQTALDAIIATTRAHEPADAGEFEYFRRCAELETRASRSSEDYAYCRADSAMRPDFRYAGAFRDPAKLAKDFPSKAEQYFNSRFCASQDGILFISGDIEEKALLQLLSETVGGFRTDGTTSKRPNTTYRQRAGEATLEAVSDNGFALFSRAAIAPLTPARLFALEAGAEVVRARLAAILHPMGFRSSVTTSYEIFPSERLGMSIKIEACNPSTLPSSVSVADVSQATAAVKAALPETFTKLPDAAEMNTAKDAILQFMDYSVSNPSTAWEFIRLRYSCGKDYTSRYREQIKSVSAQSVKEVMTLLHNGARVTVYSR